MQPQDSKDLTQVGPGTVMGDFIRQYWLPAIKSDELEAGAGPMRLMLLGEKLIAFRDTLGQVGVMDHRCPHRGASLFLGRNENGGIRCVYHGWKFDVNGHCLETPNVPSPANFKESVHAHAYSVHEQNGLIWVFMGPQNHVPPFPQFEAAMRSEAEIEVQMMQRDCNWLQSLEGDLDTSHLGFLHLGNLDADDVKDHPLEHAVKNRSPTFEVHETPSGVTCGAVRLTQTASGEQAYWRTTNFMFPFWAQIPGGRVPDYIEIRAWVPIDDNNTMHIWLRQRGHRQGSDYPLKDGRPVPGTTATVEFLPRTTDWMGRWRIKANEQNDWLLDREAQQRNHIYSGIDNIHLQDQAITESMGPISDHSLEHLAPSDRMVMRTRRRLLNAARDFQNKSVPAPGAQNPEVFEDVRSGHFVAPPSLSMLEAIAQRKESRSSIEAAQGSNIETVRPI